MRALAGTIPVGRREGAERAQRGPTVQSFTPGRAAWGETRSGIWIDSEIPPAPRPAQSKNPAQKDTAAVYETYDPELRAAGFVHRLGTATRRTW